MSEQEKVGNAPVRLPDVIHFLKCRRDDAAHELQCFYTGDYIPEQNPFAQRERLERHAIMFSEAVKHLEQPNTELRGGGDGVPGTPSS